MNGKTKGIVAAGWVLLLAVGFGCRIPDLDRFDPVAETVSGTGVSAKVTVVRDAHGIVHVEAETDEDLFFGVGYAMAQDRFTQMDYFRRAGAGRLSELFGSPIKISGVGLPNIDIGIRALRFEAVALQAVKDLDPESAKLLSAFTRGVNRFLEDGGDTIAIYHTLKTAPAPWTMADSLVVAELMGLTMTGFSFLTEYYLERVRKDFGDEVRDLFVPAYPDDEIIITRDALISAMRPDLIFAGRAGLGSNNWALSGSRTVSGLPLIANDPHVPISITPTFWWHCHLKGGSFDVMGLMFAGFPVFGAATNGKVAWALTNVMADYIDLFRERVNPDNPDQYEVDGRWENFEEVKGEVRVQGKKPVPYTMRLTRNGTVLEKDLLGWEITAASPGEVLAVRYVDMDLAAFFRGYQAMARAGDFEEWLAGAKDMALGPFAWNHVFADDQGNIAYWATGRFPIRPDNQGYIARRGWESADDWQGFVPFEDNPHLVNPKKGYLASANNRVETPDYPYYITADYSGPSRAARISELIEKKDRHDVADMQRIQSDVKVRSAVAMVPIILADLAGAKDKDLIEAATILEQWADSGFHADIDSRGTCVYEVFMVKFPEAVFGDEFGKKGKVGPSNAGLFNAALAKIIHEPQSPWFNDITTREQDTRKEIVRRTMQETMKYLRRNLGLNSDKWRWGDLATLTMSPSFVSIPGFTSKYSLGPYPSGGTGETVQAMNFLFLGRLGFMGFVGPSSRFIVDFRDPRKAYFNCTTGMAEHPLGGRYDNLTEDWLEGRYRIMSMDPDEYRINMTGEMILAP